MRLFLFLQFIKLKIFYQNKACLSEQHFRRLYKILCKITCHQVKLWGTLDMFSIFNRREDQDYGK